MDNIDLDQEITNIVWVAEDIKVLFEQNDIPFTEENYKIFLNNRAAKTLHERSIEEGWEILDTILSMCKDEMNM